MRSCILGLHGAHLPNYVLMVADSALAFQQLWYLELAFIKSKLCEGLLASHGFVHGSSSTGTVESFVTCMLSGLRHRLHSMVFSFSLPFVVQPAAGHQVHFVDA